ncbi:hypothetical protein CDAR_112081 [Caerostris darwini]|uniref:Uncharacterized protein n=1 Tax=Caerostris darwini TaxID=1538125 RepID=A0AAV4VG38_9ARAC|nr:hypothetical protein CDAR_112081 [Caerostris darwini]
MNVHSMRAVFVSYDTREKKRRAGNQRIVYGHSRRSGGNVAGLKIVKGLSRYTVKRNHTNARTQETKQMRKISTDKTHLGIANSINTSKIKLGHCQQTQKINNK